MAYKKKKKKAQSFQIVCPCKAVEYNEGFSWTGYPMEADWPDSKGQESTLKSPRNMPFDLHSLLGLKERFCGGARGLERT